MKPGKYNVVFERDPGGSWLARVPSVRGCHTHGRTLNQARRRIREALALWVDDAETVELVERVKLPKDVRATIARSNSARKAALRERAKAKAVASQAARALVEDVGMGLRDAGELLDLSHQRVQQLVGATPKRRAAARDQSRASRR